MIVISIHVVIFAMLPAACDALPVAGVVDAASMLAAKAHCATT
jgi:hypothetical protein